MASEILKPFYPVIVVGGGQAGLSVSYQLQKKGIEHLVLEKHKVMHSWKTQRWDSFTLVTPNWQCLLPDHPYDGNDPDGFMNRDETISYLERFADKVRAPVLENVTVENIRREEPEGYRVQTSVGTTACAQVVVASGGYHQPVIPRMAERLPEQVLQLHSNQYKNAAQLPEGGVLVVGAGQSGAQIAEDLHLEGKKVFLAVGKAPRVARRYRGKDVVKWLEDMGYYRKSVDQHPLREGVRDNTNHYVTGRDGGRDIDLRRFASEGMELFGGLEDFDGRSLVFRPDLEASLDYADSVYNDINSRVDRYIEEAGIDAPQGGVYTPHWKPVAERTRLDLQAAGISAVIWCIGFRPDFSWLDVPVFNGRGAPVHQRGITAVPGVYFVGLPWLHTWGSGRFSGVAEDSAWLAQAIEESLSMSHDEECV